MNVNIKYCFLFVCMHVVFMPTFCACLPHMCVHECEGLKLMSGLLVDGSLFIETVSHRTWGL